MNCARVIILWFLLLQCATAHSTKRVVLNKRNSLQQNLTACWESCLEWKDDVPAVYTVGAYIVQITNVDAHAGTFFAVGYTWVYYNYCQRLDGEPVQPQLTLSLENIVNDIDFGVYEELGDSLCDRTESGLGGICPICDNPAPGMGYLSWKFRGEFASPFDFTRYPLDTQELYIAYEDIVSDNTTLTLVADTRDTQIHPALSISGFMPTKPVARCYPNAARTFYGDPLLFGYSLEEADQQDPHRIKAWYSRCELGVKVKRNPVFFVMRVLPPAIITLAISTLILFLDPMRLDARLTTATTGLLTEVFLQLGFSDKIPDVGVVTVSDWVFNWCFLLLLVIISDCIVVHCWLKYIERRIVDISAGIEMTMMDTMESKDEAAEMRCILDRKRRRAMRLDRYVVYVISGLGTIGSILVIVIAAYA